MAYFYDSRGVAYPIGLADPSRTETRAPGSFVPDPAFANPEATEWTKRYGGGYGSWLTAALPEYEQWKTGIKPGMKKEGGAEFPGGSWDGTDRWAWDAPRDFEGAPWKSLEGQVTYTGDWRPEYTWAESMNQLIPFMNPNDWQWTTDQLRGLNLDVFNNYDEFGGGQGWNAYKAPRLSQAEEYQYFTQPRISDIANILFGPAVPTSGVEGGGAPFARGEPTGLEYGKGILNWGGEEQTAIEPYIKAAINAAARYAPQGSYVPGARRSMRQQAEYNTAMEDIWNKNMGTEEQQTEWELWRPFLQRLLSPTTNVTPGTYLAQPSARRYTSVLGALTPPSYNNYY